MKIYDKALFRCSNSYIFIISDFLTAYSNSQIVLKNNNIRLFDSIIESYNLSQIQLQLDNKFFAKNISIKVKKYSNVEFFNSNFVALRNIVIEYNSAVNILKNIFAMREAVFCIKCYGKRILF